MEKWLLVQERSEKWPLGMTFFPAMSFPKRISSAIGVDYEDVVCVYGENARISVFVPTKNVRLVARYCLHLIEEDPFLPNKLLAKFNSRAQKFLDYARQALEPPFAKKSDAELAEWYEKFTADYWDAYVFGEPLAFLVQDALSEKLEAVLRVRLRQKNSEHKFGEAFTLLTAVREKAFASREEESLLRIAAKIAEDDELAAKFKKLDAAELAKKLREEPIKRAIDEHAREFYWIPFDYAGGVWDETHFLATLKEILASRLDVRRRLAEINDYYATLEKKQAALEEELGFSEREKQLFAASRALTWTMDWKKEVFTKAHYCARSVVTEFAKRFSLSLESAYCATPPEIAAFLSGDKKLDALARESLESRTRFCVLHGKGLEARVLEGDADFEEHEVHGIEGLSEHPESHEEEAHGYPAGH